MEINARQVIDLISCLNNLTEGFDDVFLSKKYNLTIKDKILILISEQPLSPFLLMKKLGVVKTNLALMCNDLVKNNYIEKSSDKVDKRGIVYKITEIGLKRAEEILNVLNKNINVRIQKTESENVDNIIKKLLELLSNN